MKDRDRKMNESKRSYSDFNPGVAFCMLSLFCACIMAFFDSRAAKILKKAKAETGEKIRITDVKDFPLSVWLIFIICVTYYVAVFPFISLGLLLTGCMTVMLSLALFGYSNLECLRHNSRCNFVGYFKSRQAITCSKSTKETLEKGVKYVQ